MTLHNVIPSLHMAWLHYGPQGWHDCTMALGDGIFVLCHYYTLYHYYTIYYSTCSIALCDCLYEPKGSDRAMLTKTMKTSFRFLFAPTAAHPVLRYAGLKQNIKRASPCGFSLHFKLCLSFDEGRINGAGSLYKIPCTVHRWHASRNTVPKTSNLARNREVQRLGSTPQLLSSTLFLKMYDISLRGEGTSWKSTPGAQMLWTQVWRSTYIVKEACRL